MVNPTTARRFRHGQQVPIKSKLDRRHFCIYCKKLLVKLPRHLEHAHINEKEVREMCLLPKGMIIKHVKDIIQNAT